MTRDMTDGEFKSALKRRGWGWAVGWVTIPAPQTGGTCGIGCVMTKKQGQWKLDRRATLAKAIKAFEQSEAAE